MTELATFWNDKHPLTAQANALFDALVPDSGYCSTVVGELLRASTKISYDWFNNGWGCNNWSGAVVFIRQNYKALQLSEENVKRLKQALSYVIEYSHGEPSPKNEDRADENVTTIHEIIVQGIIDTPFYAWKANTQDMYELSEEDYQHRWGDSDEDKYRW